MHLNHISKLFFFLSFVALTLLGCESIKDSPTSFEYVDNLSLSKTILSTPDIVVTTTSDVADFSGNQQIDDLPGNDGLVSLREAIIAANNTVGPNVIGFNIPTSDPGFYNKVFTIKPSDKLPDLIGGETIINGFTQTDFTGDTNPEGPEIELVHSFINSYTLE